MTGPHPGRTPRDVVRSTTRPEEETRPIAGGPIGFDGRHRSGGGSDPVERARRIESFRRIGTETPQAPDAADHSGQAAAAPRTGPDPEVVHRDPRFRALRSRVRRFVFLGTSLFLGWYAVFVGLSAFAPGLVATPVIGSVNLGLLLGLAQFVSTLAIVGVYGRFARREIDPRVRELRSVYSEEPPSSQTALIAPVNARRNS